MSGQNTAEASDVLSHALRYARLGWHLVPMRSWLTLVEPREASREEGVLREWWARWPNAGVAVVLEPSRLCVINVESDIAKERWQYMMGQEPWRSLRMPRLRTQMGHILFFRLPNVPRPLRWRTKVNDFLVMTGYLPVVVPPAPVAVWDPSPFECTPPVLPQRRWIFW